MGDARKVIDRIAEVAAAFGASAGVGGMELAGMIVSVLHANPEHIERFMESGTELFIDGTICQENGSLTHHAINGLIVSPAQLREAKGGKDQ